jgi:hypothetical protein
MNPIAPVVTYGIQISRKAGRVGRESYSLLVWFLHAGKRDRLLLGRFLCDCPRVRRCGEQPALVNTLGVPWWHDRFGIGERIPRTSSES